MGTAPTLKRGATTVMGTTPGKREPTMPPRGDMFPKRLIVVAVGRTGKHTP